MTSDLKNNFDEWYDVNNIMINELLNSFRSKLRYIIDFRDIRTKIE